MGVAENEAWVTTVVDDDVVIKALTLAASLRRVRTTRKLVVLTCMTVSKMNREKLKDVFDLVHLIEPDCPSGWDLESYAKVQSFSLHLFKKCVYISPTALVIKNCDEIFENHCTFAATYSGVNKNDIDLSIYFYAPNMGHAKSLGGGRNDGDFSKYFRVWLENNIPNTQKLDDAYNVMLNLKGNAHQRLNMNMSIVNFIDAHPLDFADQIMKMTALDLGVVEKFAVDQCWKIYTEDVKNFSMESSITFQAQYKTEPVAIVGMSFRLPGGNDVDEFWSLLAEGRNAVLPLPSNRWTKEHSYFHCKNRQVEAGFLSVPIDEFDSKFFGLSPKESEFLDPQQRMLLEVNWEALEDAMIDPSKLKGTQTGVFVGSWIHDYKDILHRSEDVDFFRTYMGNSIATTAARLSHFLETTGPSIATESGCSSAIAAVDMACKSLANGDSSLAIAAGVNLLIGPFDPSLMEYVLSPDCRCKTFDAGANGFARAEGCAVLILKRLSDAVKDGDCIWGLIRGSALTQEGVSKSMGTPTVHCESLAMELALRNAGVDPKDVSYIEAHGTGTPVGDPMEISAIQKAYSGGRSEPLVIGSVKTNVGHTEAVSGITGIIKVLLSMKNEIIPKHLNFESLNPNINLAAIPAEIPLSEVPWPKNGERRRIAGVSSFGISGSDGHVIIEEPPELLRNQLKLNHERPLHIMKLSTKSAESMDLFIQKYLAIFRDKNENNELSEEGFANFAYSANVGRATFNHRAVIIAKNFSGATQVLQEKSFKKLEVQKLGSSLCFLFTGQGSQYPSMAKQLYETSPVFRDSFDKCDSVLQRNYNISIKNVLWAEAGSTKELNRTLYSQTSIFVVEYCLFELWESWGIKPDFVLGHSLGEFAAAVAAGALDLADALMLVAERSLLIDQLPRGKMLVIRADKKRIDKLILSFQKIRSHKFWVDYAALNSSDQTVVAGDSEMIEDFSKFCQEKSVKTIVLAATHAFHSRHMDPMLGPYQRVATALKTPQAKSNPPKYISGLEGKLIDLDSIDVSYWVRHARERVNFIDACRAVKEQDCTLFLEVGPHPVLSALTMMNSERNQITCFPSIRRNEEEWVTMLDTLAKLFLSSWKGEIDWMGFDRFYARKKVKLPFYPFSRKSIWTRVDSEYPKIHPLIGRLIPTASTETVFQNSLTLKSINFVQDHVIGNSVIFPGAAYLEMCLAGGHSTVQGFTEDLMQPRRPIFLKSFKIESPLALDESKSCRLQTLVTLNDEQNEPQNINVLYSVGIHRLHTTDEGITKWIPHASAKFSPIAPSLPKQVSATINISEIQLSWGESDNIKSFYEKLHGVGLRFGPQFQSLESEWKCDKGFLASVKVPKDHKKYLIHPVIVDAMIQAFIIWSSKDKPLRKLHVPIQIGEFVWLKGSDSNTRFVYCSNEDNKDPYCLLVDETGSPLAYMKKVDFIETTVKLVEGMVMQQTTAMPNLWEDVWKSSDGPMQGYLTHDTPIKDFDFTEVELRFFEESNKIHEDEQRFCNNLIKFTRCSILKAMYILGWKPEMKQSFSVESLLKDLCIKNNFKQHISYFLRSMAKDECRILRTTDIERNIFQFCGPPPTIDELKEEMERIKTSLDYTRVEYLLILELEAVLSNILKGEVNPLGILFPQDPSKPSAGKVYKSGIVIQTHVPASSKMIRHGRNAEHDYKNSSKSTQCPPNYRVLEIGAGTGVSTKTFLKDIIPRATSGNVEYYFTDVSPAFFNSAEKELHEYRKSLVFKKYDIDEDPLEQGLCPGYFDVITATEVLHVAKDIKKTMKSLRSLLKPGGLIVIYETINPDERVFFIFGLLDGYWQFEDREFRKEYTTLTPEMWREALTESGFDGVSVTPTYNSVHGVIIAHASQVENNFLVNIRSPSKTWVIFGDNDDFSKELHKKILSVNRKCRVIHKLSRFTEETMKVFMNDALILATQDGSSLEGVVYLWSLSPGTRDQYRVSLPFLTIMQFISKLQAIPKVFAVLQGACDMESSDVTDPTPGTLIGFCKSLSNENSDVSVRFLDLDPLKLAIDQLDELFMNLWVDHKQSAAFRDGLRLRPKLRAGKIARNQPLSLPSGCDRFQLLLPKTRLISDLEFAYLEPYTIGENEVEVQVKAAALNFRDVFAVLKPTRAFEKFNSIGIEFSGVVAKAGGKVTRVRVGDRVVGMADNVSLPSHYKIREENVIPFPESMTFAEAVTLPIGFFTAALCLIYTAKMKKGETVLIHTASGGVGLVAIQVCKYYGVNIIATAGSRRKQNYLRNIGIEHVFHSRTTDFRSEILRITEGRGVDIVLNSLTGPGFKEASLDVLSHNGRFIEMSKLNVWSKAEVETLRPDVFYEIVDLIASEPHVLESLAKDFVNLIQFGSVKPIPYECFDALNIRGALNYLQQAKHIGKIVCIMPEVKLKKSKLVAKTPLFNGNSTYLVTGGLGGIGFEVVKWMLSKGAKYVVILSRNPPKPEMASQINEWNKAGNHVHAFSVDVGNYDKLKELMEDLKRPELGFPQVRGVMHAAGILKDELLENQTWETFTQTYNPKVNGSWNLHDLTKDCLLEHFVLFSSMTATFGSPGQTNHCASNAFQDSLAAYRKSNGLPATSINWGNWGEVGVATEVDFPGIRPISTSEGLLALETFLKTQTSRMCVLNVESFSLFLKLLPQLRHYLDDSRLFGELSKTTLVSKAPEIPDLFERDASILLKSHMFPNIFMNLS